MQMVDLPADLAAIVNEQIEATTLDQRQAAFGTKAPVWQAYMDDQHLIIVVGPKAALLEARRFNREYATPLPGFRVIDGEGDRGSMHIDAHARNLLVTGAGAVETGPHGSITAEPDSAFALQGIRITGSGPKKYRIRTAFVATFSEAISMDSMAKPMRQTLSNAFSAKADTEH